MFIVDCDPSEVEKQILKYLKSAGIKQKIKKISINQNGNIAVGNFKIRLENLQCKEASLYQYDQPINIPSFLVDCCDYLTSKERITSEGLFRISGTAIGQKLLKNFLANGGDFTDGCERKVADVADLLKMFFRELPEPCIPYVFHEVLERCCESKESKELIFLILLLLPHIHICTLAYITQFLKKVAFNSSSNRMDVANLAIVWSPNLMPFKKGYVINKQALEKRRIIVQHLIEDSDQIGIVPDWVCNKLSCWGPSSLSSTKDMDSSKTSKKKRRSGSLTRMISGFKKMIRKSEMKDQSDRSPVTPPPQPHTPCIISSSKKRKASESNLHTFSAKKRKNLLGVLPQKALLPDVCTTTYLTPRIVIAQPEVQQSQRRLSRRLHLSHSGITNSYDKSSENLQECGLLESPALNNVNSANNYFHLARQEYRDIENRVSKIESRISSEFENLIGVNISDLDITTETLEPECIGTVQSAYEKVLESAEKFNSPTSNELAKQFSKDLHIRRSSGKNNIRSPSARKIGSLRRRSKENTPQFKNEKSNLHYSRSFNTFYHEKSNIQPSWSNCTNCGEHVIKDLDCNNLGVLTRSQIKKSCSFHKCDLNKLKKCDYTKAHSGKEEVIQWKNAEDFINNESEELVVTGRPSLVKLRSQNAGMVLSKAKAFNAVGNLNHTYQRKLVNFNSHCDNSPKEVKKMNSSNNFNDIIKTRNIKQESVDKPTKPVQISLTNKTNCVNNIPGNHGKQKSTVDSNSILKKPSFKKSTYNENLRNVNNLGKQRISLSPAISRISSCHSVKSRSPCPTGLQRKQNFVGKPEQIHLTPLGNDSVPSFRRQNALTSKRYPRQLVLKYKNAT